MQITMVMPVYGGNMAHDEEHGRNQTLAKIARKTSAWSLKKGSALPAARTSLGSGVGNVPSRPWWGVARPLEVLLCFLEDIGMANSFLFCSIVFIHFSFSQQLD